MTRAFALIIPAIFILSFAFALYKKVPIFNSFTEGMKGAVTLVVSIFPYVAAVTMLTTLLDVSGLSEKMQVLLHPLFSFAGVPEELAPLLIVKPLSGSGSIAVLSDLLQKYGVDSYIARCACVAYGCSDTIFYIGAVYFAGIKRKRLTTALVIAVLSYLLSVVFCCFLCNSM